MPQPMESAPIEPAVQTTIQAQMTSFQLEAVTALMDNMGIAHAIQASPARPVTVRPFDLLEGVFAEIVEERTRRAAHGINNLAMVDRVRQRQARLFIEASAE